MQLLLVGVGTGTKQQGDKNVVPKCFQTSIQLVPLEKKLELTPYPD